MKEFLDDLEKKMLNEKHRVYGKTKILNTEELKKIFSSELFDYVKVVLLFGSRAVGNFHDRSDYDFAVLADETKDDSWGVISKVWADVGSALHLEEIDYDVIDLTTATPQMKSSICKGYEILKGNSDDISRIFR